MKRPRRYKTILPRIASSIIDGIVFIPVSIIESRFTDTTNKVNFIGFTLLFALIWISYRVFMHGRYGQTLGKMASHVKVFSEDEKEIVSYKNAFLREILGLCAVVFCLLYLAVSPGNGSYITGVEETNYTIILYWTYGLLSLLEIVVMIINPKRRALHDIIAGSVTLDVTPYKKWDIEYEETPG